MLFTQFEFLFLFLPLTFAGYFLIAYLVDTPTARLSWLAAASLLFYSYWDVRFVPIIIVSILFLWRLSQREELHQIRAFRHLFPASDRRPDPASSRDDAAIRLQGQPD